MRTTRAQKRPAEASSGPSARPSSSTFPSCSFRHIADAEANKASFAELLEDSAGSLIFAAGHGCALPNSDPRQRLDLAS